VLREQPPAVATGHEGDHVVRGGGRLREIDNRFLGDGVRRPPGGRQVIALRDEWRMTTPGGALIRLLAGIVTLMADDSSSLSPLISAAVPPGPGSDFGERDGGVG
jgi:hypothetical protein